MLFTLPTAAPQCMCDPLSPTTDCEEQMCDPFFGVFFALQLLLLLAVAGLVALIELKGLKKYYLWRFILVFGTVAETGTKQEI